MNSYGYGPEQGPRPGRRAPWLVPVLIGAGIGALLMVLLNGFSWWGDYGRGGSQFSNRAPHAQQWQTAPNSAQPPTSPQQQSVPVAPQAQRGFGGKDRPGMMGGRQHGWFSFLPFGGGRLILPLLLIAGGAWLLSRPRRGSGNYGPPPTQPGNMPTPPTQPGPEQDPPATSDTQRL